MKLTSKGYLDRRIGRHCSVTVDGEPVEERRLMEADEEGHVVLFVEAPPVEGQNPHIRRYIPERGSAWNCKTEVLEGRVRISLKDTAPPEIARAYQAFREYERRLQDTGS